jgi:hypothetical protein
LLLHFRKPKRQVIIDRGGFKQIQPPITGEGDKVKGFFSRMGSVGGHGKTFDDNGKNENTKTIYKVVQSCASEVLAGNSEGDESCACPLKVEKVSGKEKRMNNNGSGFIQSR